MSDYIFLASALFLLGLSLITLGLAILGIYRARIQIRLADDVLRRVQASNEQCQADAAIRAHHAAIQHKRKLRAIAGGKPGCDLAD